MAPSGAVPYGHLPFPGLNQGISARWSSARVFPTESRTFCPISSRPDLGLSQGRENFPSEEAHVASPFFFSIQPWDLVLQLSPMSRSSWQGSLGTRWVLTRPRRSRSFHPSSSRFPSEFRDIFPHLSPQKTPIPHCWLFKGSPEPVTGAGNALPRLPAIPRSFIAAQSHPERLFQDPRLHPIRACSVLVFQPKLSTDCFGWILSSCFDQILWSFVSGRTEPGPALPLIRQSREPGASPRMDTDLSG